MANEFLAYPRRRHHETVVSDPVPIFTTAERVCGIDIYNSDPVNPAGVDFMESDETTPYFSVAVPAGETIFWPIQFYANHGLTVINGVADQVELTVWWVGFDSRGNVG